MKQLSDFLFVRLFRKKYRVVVLHIFFYFSLSPILAQKIPDFNTDVISKVNIDTVYVFRVSGYDKKINHKVNKMYYWFYHDNFNNSQGSHFGRLLHGTYEKTFLKGNPIEQGEFKHGLKINKWSEWYPNGYFKSRHTYRKGILQGVYMNYEETGKRSQKGRYMNEMQHGKLITYETNPLNPEINISEVDPRIISKLSASWLGWYYGKDLKSIYTFKKGERHGKFAEFNLNGYMVKKGKYKNGWLDGRVIEYKGGEKNEQSYKNGILVIPVSDEIKNQNLLDTAQTTKMKKAGRKRKNRNKENKDQQIENRQKEPSEPAKKQRKWRKDDTGNN
jgi:antitoxin component YwqK of YwqJK toxin-antitoxin module